MVSILVNAGDGELSPRPTKPDNPTAVPKVERSLLRKRLSGVGACAATATGLAGAGFGGGAAGLGGAGGGQISSP